MKKKITNIEANRIEKEKNINSKFSYSLHNKLNINCNTLSGNFFLDSYNFFPITDEYYTFLDTFSWGDKSKYKNFYTENFKENFNKNINNFKTISDVYVLGSSYSNNYYRNLLTFLPRIFFNDKNKIKLAIHRNTSNKFRKFIESLSVSMGFDIQFIFLDDGFYRFTNSRIPQIFPKNESIKILNTLMIHDNSKKEKIYISRQNCSYRNLINEADVIENLKKIGFRLVDLSNFTIHEQIELFSSAEIIVSPTGSSLANIVFCKPGTKIFEISPTYNFTYENSFKLRYEYIAKVLNLNYTRIEADSIELESKNDKYINKILPDVLEKSNYYKNLIIKINNFNKFFKI